MEQTSVRGFGLDSDYQQQQQQQQQWWWWS
jgi:hypothetical protein